MATASAARQRQRGAAQAKVGGGDDQRGKDDVGQRVAHAERHDGQRDDQRQHAGCLADQGPAERRAGPWRQALAPDKQQRGHEQPAGHVAEPPGVPDRPHARRRHLVTQPGGDGADRGGEGYARRQRQRHRGHLVRPVKPGAPAEQAAHQERGKSELDDVAERLERHHGDVVVEMVDPGAEQQVRDGGAGEPAQVPEVEHGGRVAQRQPGHLNRPGQQHHAAELGQAVVAEPDQEVPGEQGAARTTGGLVPPWRASPLPTRHVTRRS